MVETESLSGLPPTHLPTRRGPLGCFFARSGRGETEADEASDSFGQGHALSFAISAAVGRDAGDTERFPSAGR
jgi:hypothetical protein